MGTKLYVGNLSFSMDDTHLAEVFARAGTVTSAQVIADKFSGQSRGFGFVEMSTEAEVAQAITMLNGQDIDGRPLTVNEAHAREERGARRSDGGRNRY